MGGSGWKLIYFIGLIAQIWMQSVAARAPIICIAPKLRSFKAPKMITRSKCDALQFKTSFSSRNQCNTAKSAHTNLTNQWDLTRDL